MEAEPSDLALAAFVVLGALLDELREQGVLTDDQFLNVWRRAAANNLAGVSANKQMIDAVIRYAAPKGARL